jgi:hypothetical protein
MIKQYEAERDSSGRWTSGARRDGSLASNR